MNNNPPSTFLQAKNEQKNRVILSSCRELGFFMPDIRRALLALNQVRLLDLCEDGAGGRVCTPAVASHVIAGEPRQGVASAHARQRCSAILGVPAEELFADVDLAE